MSSDAYHKLWVWNSSGNAWVEVQKFAKMRLSHTTNFIPTLKVVIYDTGSALLNYMTAGNAFRVTDKDSTDGLVATLFDGTASGEGGTGQERMIGTLTPHDDNLTSRTGIAGKVYLMEGHGLEHRVSKTEYTLDTEWEAQALDDVLTDIITDSGLTVGTIDTTNPTISMAVRDDKVWGLLMDAAALSSGGTKFVHYVYATATDAATGDFTPKVHVRKYDSSIYSVSTPTPGVDDDRIIHKHTEIRGGMSIIREQDRIVNDIKVTWGKTRSSVTQSDGTSQAAYGKRSRVINAPWIRDSTTAQYLADTIVEMLKGDGSDDGIKRGVATLKYGGVYTGQDFTAILGDVVSIYDGTNTIITGKFLGWTYVQDDASLTVTIGLPRAPFYEDYANLERRVQQQINAVLTSENVTTTTTGSSVLSTVSDGVNYSASNLTSPPTNLYGFDCYPSAGSVYREFDISISVDDFRDADEYYLTFGIRPTVPLDGPVYARVVAYTAAGAAADPDLLRHTFGPMLPMTSEYYYAQATLNLTLDAVAALTRIRIILTNLHNAGGTVDRGNVDWTIRLHDKPLHAHDMP